MSDTNVYGDTEAEENFLDSQITYIAGFALIALIVCVVLLVIFSANLTGIGPTFQLIVTTITNRISASFQPLFLQAQQSVGVVEAQVTIALGQVADSIVSGVTQVGNVVLSIGNELINIIQVGFQGMLNLLQEAGGDILQFFSNIFQPIVTVVQILGTLAIDSLELIVAQYQPILTLISALITAVEQIGHKF